MNAITGTQKMQERNPKEKKKTHGMNSVKGSQILK